MILELLTLFWIFFKIGLFTFGGGYAMIPLMKSEIVGGGYIEIEMLYDFIGISESTPGPFAINMATFIGMNQHGLIGAFVTTLGVALPSFIIILLIASLGSKFLDSKGVKRAFLGLKPAVIGLILAVSIGLFIHALFPNIDLDTLSFDLSLFNWYGFAILSIIIFLSFIHKKISPIQIILVSAVLGMIIYSIF
ncbi:MAG: chromate transporter [Acholeplasmataceae bacterium]|nr:chromate transporter [Acholeplasmataceae bacterium]